MIIYLTGQIRPDKLRENLSALLGDEHCEQLQVLKFEPGRQPAQLRFFKRMDGFRILRHFKIVKLVVSISFIVFMNLLNRE